MAREIRLARFHTTDHVRETPHLSHSASMLMPACFRSSCNRRGNRIADALGVVVGFVAVR